VKGLKKVSMTLAMMTLLFMLVVPVIATESITQDDFYADVDADGSGFRIKFGKGDNERNLVIWSFYEFDDENEDHKFQDTELIVGKYLFSGDYVLRRGRHLPTTNIDEEYLWYLIEWDDGTRLEIDIYIRPPNLEIEITLANYHMVQEWNDLAIIYETDDKGKHAAFEYQAGEVKIVEKLNPNILDRILESLPF